MQPEPLTLGDVEAEYRRRHSWWHWAPVSERAAFTYAALHHDKGTMRRLTRRGKRREQLKESRSCYQPDNTSCDCVVRALESAVLWREVRGQRFAAATVTFFAERLHENPAFDIKARLAAKKKEAELRDSMLLHAELEALDRERTAVVEVDPEEIEAQVEQPPLAEPHQAHPRVPDSWRWRSENSQSVFDGLFGSDDI